MYNNEWLTFFIFIFYDKSEIPMWEICTNPYVNLAFLCFNYPCAMSNEYCAPIYATFTGKKIIKKNIL
jgi:hypothetical protein